MGGLVEGWGRPRRVALLATYDAVAWLASVVLFSVIRLDSTDSMVPVIPVLFVGWWAVVLHLLLSRLVHFHQGRTEVGSFEDMVLLAGVTGATGVLVTSINALMSPYLIPRSVPVAATFSALAAMGAGRAVWRRLKERQREHRSADGTRVLIFGAGEGGRQLIGSMLRDPHGTWAPVALLDDDPLKCWRRIRHVPVRGTRQVIAAVAALTDATALIIAIPSAGRDVIREVGDLGREAGLEVKVVPGVDELFDQRVDVSDVRDIDVTDLLGRHQIETDLASVAGYLTGKRVLVTGAGGSIGSELCRQIHRFGPAELIMLDRDESALHAVQLSIYGRALLDSSDVVLGDIRDTQFVIGLFEQRRPHVVFHAAALKHLPMLEQYPGEAIKTNVWGTLTVLEAAEHVGVERFVNISTDKAANPCSVLGYSKRIAEGLTSAIALQASGTFLSVRFGNVLGSRGSVLISFADQIAHGGPVTVTHPDVTRYFMTIQEAVELVIQAAAFGRSGEALVLDMGSPVRIADVARQLISLARREISIEFTGLRQGEKMHEELFGDGEPDERPVHPLVSHVRVPGIDPTDARAMDPWLPQGDVVAAMQPLCDACAHSQRRNVLAHR